MASTYMINQNATSMNTSNNMYTDNTFSDAYKPSQNITYPVEDTLKAEQSSIISNTDIHDSVLPNSIWDAAYFKSPKEEADYYKSHNEVVYQALLNSLFSLSERETKAEYISVYTRNKQEIIKLNDVIQSLKDLISRFDLLMSYVLTAQGDSQSWDDAVLDSRNLIQDIHDVCEGINRSSTVASARASRIVMDIEQHPSWQYAQKEDMFSYARLSEALRKAHEQVSSDSTDKN